MSYSALLLMQKTFSADLTNWRTDRVQLHGAMTVSKTFGVGRYNAIRVVLARGVQQESPEVGLGAAAERVDQLEALQRVAGLRPSWIDPHSSWFSVP
jgi:hypothetical protein